MKSSIKYLISGILLLLALSAYAIPKCPNPQRLVNDFADVFTLKQESELEKKLVEFDKKTSNQITVVTVNDLEGCEASEYATRIGLDWGVGTKEFNNGIVLLIKPKTSRSSGEVFIAIGYGLEGNVPDAYAKRIVENELIPNFKKDDYYSGASAACNTLIKLISGEIGEPKSKEPALTPFAAKMIIVIFLLLFLITVFKSKGKSGGRYVSRSGSSSSHRSSFGGFRRGSFGGGGAGGKW